MWMLLFKTAFQVKPYGYVTTRYRQVNQVGRWMFSSSGLLTADEYDRIAALICFINWPMAACYPCSNDVDRQRPLVLAWRTVWPWRSSSKRCVVDSVFITLLPVPARKFCPASRFKAPFVNTGRRKNGNLKHLVNCQMWILCGISENQTTGWTD